MSKNIRLAYLLDWKFAPRSGVGKKIVDQISSWNSLGMEVTLFISCPLNHEADWANLPFKVHVFTYTSYISRSKARKRSLQQVVDDKFEIMYTRFGILSPFTIRKMKNISTILELNTKGIIEYKRRSKILYLYALATSEIILNNAAGICSVTQEIAQEAEKIAGKEINYKVIPNSINLARFTEYLPPKNTRAKLVFVGSPGQVWHGVDRISELASRFPDYDFYVIGPKQIFEKPSNLIFVGEIYNKKLNDFLKGMDVAISSLALERNLMSEGCPIKTRFYLAMGLPVILGYTDTGIDTKSNYIFPLSPSDWPINANTENELRKFIDKWKGQRVSHQVLGLIDSKNIENERVAFILQTKNSNKIQK